MKKIAHLLFGRLLPIIVLFLIAAILLFPAVSREGIRDGLDICRNAILPTLFPFFVISELMIGLGYTGWAAGIAAPMMNAIFHLPGETAIPYILGLIGGYPAGAKAAAEQFRNGYLSKRDTEQLLLFCNNAGPAFIVGFVGAGILHNISAGIILYLIHILTSIIMGIIFRSRTTNTEKCNFNEIFKSSGSVAITNAIKKGGSTTIHVCIYIIFFSVLSAYMESFLPHKLQTHLTLRFLIASIELAGGITALSSALGSDAMFIISAFMIGWGGFCVYFQTLSILEESGLNPRYYLPAKLLHGSIGTILAIVSLPLIRKPYTVFTTTNGIIFGAILTISVIAVLLLKKSTGKQTGNAV